MTSVRRLLPAVLTIASTGSLAASAAIVALLTARWLGPSERGDFVILSTSATLLLLVLSLGCGTGMRVLMHADPPLELLTARSVALGLAAAGAGVTAAVAWPLLKVTGASTQLWLVVSMVLLTVLQLLNYLQRELIHGLGRHATALVGETCGNLLVLGAVVTLYVSAALTLRWVVIWFVIAALGQAVILGALLGWFRPMVQRDPYWRTSRVIRRCLPSLGYSLGQSAISRGDRLIVGALVGTAGVGVYGAAATMAEAVGLVSLAMSQMVLRRVSVTKEPREARPLVAAGLGLSLIVALVVAMFARPILELVLGGSFVGGATSLRILAAAAVPFAAYMMAAAILNAQERFVLVQRVNMLGLAVMVALCFALIPRWGINGAALASLAAYIGMAAGAAAGLRQVSRTPLLMDGN